MAQTNPNASQSSRRHAVLGALRASSEPLGVTELAEQIGIHPNTVRFHLDALVSAGTVDRTGEQPSGPGRPRTVYFARPGMDRSGLRHYRLLAEILVNRMAADADTKSDTVDLGRLWGQHLINRPPPFHRITTEEAIDRLTVMLTELGFDPETVDDSTVVKQLQLHNCPFLELAEEYTETVCSLHLGLMQGALTEIDSPVQTTRLEPFAKPGTCLAHFSSNKDIPIS